MRKIVLFAILLAMYTGQLLAQARLVTGKVTDTKDGTPLAGVSVFIKGTNQGTSTAADGSFKINIPGSNVTLSFTYVGYLTKQVAVGNATNLEVSLEVDPKKISEVVVVAYGVQKKREVTGAITSVKATDISYKPIVSTEQALQGAAAGVSVTQASGTPGSGISVRVRGAASISASNQPLYVVDGIPINTGSYTQLGAGGQVTNALADINPSDIESIEVLKDASAAAIYGSRASNGVVIITTKRGANQKTRININSYYGTQEVAKKLDLITGPQYVELVQEAVKNRFGPTVKPSALGLSGLDADPNSYPTTNWMDKIFVKAPIRAIEVSANGGNDRTRFLISGNYFNQDGIVLGSGYNRFNFRLNLDNKVSDRLSVGTSTSFSRSVANRINNDNNIYGVVSTAILLGTHIPAYNPDGTYARDPNSSIENPLAAAKEPTFQATNFRLLSSVYADYKITSSLNFRSSVGVDYLSLHDFRFYPTTTNAGAGTKGSGAEGYNSDLNLVQENTLTYKKSYKGGHDLTALAGFSFQTSKGESIFAAATNFPGNGIRRLSAGSVKTDASSAGTSWGLVSYFGRLNYAYKSKYLFTGSIRVDGSSRFGANKRYGTFPAASVGYVLSEEKFMKRFTAISDLKLRASWGLTGNQEIGNFTSLALVGGGANYIQTGGLAPTQLGNPDLTWENTEQYNIGADLSLFENRVNLTADVFRKTTKELLLGQPLVGSSGFISVQKNIGSVRNDGVELGVNGYVINNQQFKWNANFNISFIKNKVLKLAGAPFAAGFASWVQEGYALGSFRGYRVEKIFQTQDEISKAPTQSTLTKPGDIKFKDLNGDGKITSDDQEILGNAQPKFYGGFTNTISYKGFDLTAFFQFTYGNLIYNNTRAFSEGMNSIFGQTADVLKRWTPTNTNTNIPRAVLLDPNNNRRTSDRFLEDGSYLRLRNLSLGYNFDPTLVRRWKLSSLRLYINSQNLITWTKYKGLDPEVSTFSDTNTAPGTDFLTFPQSRIVTVGINVGF